MRRRPVQTGAVYTHKLHYCYELRKKKADNLYNDCDFKQLLPRKMTMSIFCNCHLNWVVQTAEDYKPARDFPRQYYHLDITWLKRDGKCLI